MAQKSKQKAQESSNTTQDTTSETMNAGRRTFEEAADKTRRLQNDAMQWWTRLLSKTASTADWQRYVEGFNKMAAESLPMAQRRMNDWMTWMEKSSRMNAEIMQQALEASRTPILADTENKWMQLWTSSMKAVQAHVETASEISTRAMDSWMQLVRHNTEELHAKAA